MAGTTEELLNKLSNMIQNAFSLPLGAERCIIDRDKALGLIDEIRSAMPPEIKRACEIVERKNDMIAEAKRDAAAILRQAEERAVVLLNEHKLVREAKNKTHDMMEQAKNRDRELRRAANAYVDSTLKRLDEFTAKTHSEVQKARQEFRAAARASDS